MGDCLSKKKKAPKVAGPASSLRDSVMEPRTLPAPAPTTKRQPCVHGGFPAFPCKPRPPSASLPPPTAREPASTRRRTRPKPNPPKPGLNPVSPSVSETEVSTSSLRSGNSKGATSETGEAEEDPEVEATQEDDAHDGNRALPLLAQPPSLTFNLVKEKKMDKPALPHPPPQSPNSKSQYMTLPSEGSSSTNALLPSPKPSPGPPKAKFIPPDTDQHSGYMGLPPETPSPSRPRPYAKSLYLALPNDGELPKVSCPAPASAPSQQPKAGGPASLYMSLPPETPPANQSRPYGKSLYLGLPNGDDDLPKLQLQSQPQPTASSTAAPTAKTGGPASLYMGLPPEPPKANPPSNLRSQYMEPPGPGTSSNAKSPNAPSNLTSAYLPLPPG